MSTQCEHGQLARQCLLCEQAAEIERLRAKAESKWQPIETAPKDGTQILVGNRHGAWLAMYRPIYQSGYSPQNPWFSLMINHGHMKVVELTPTHWMPLPAAPSEHFDAALAAKEE